MSAPRLPVHPTELALRGAIARNGFENWLARELVAILDAAYLEVARRLLAEGDSLTVRDRRRLMGFLDQVERHVREAYGVVNQRALSILSEYGIAESRVAVHEVSGRIALAGGNAAGVEASAQLLARQTVRSIAELPIEGLRLGDWWTRQAETMSITTRRAIQQGLVLGEGPRDIVRRILPSRDSTAPAVSRRARRDAVTVVRTTVTAVHTHSAQATYVELGEDVTGSYELVTARDSRVSQICAPLDGLVFRYSDPKRLEPPFHPNCRTTTVPVINYEGLRLKPPPAGPKYNLPSFASWLSGQSVAVQNGVLGPGRADLWRAGSITLGDILDDSQRIIPLEVLRRELGAA
jgi:SPP1 gp7 family putative phage head morphogenesis protein